MSGPTPYSGYRHRAVPAPDPELTQVGPDTPCGEYLRRVWQPVAMLAELGERPLALRILGEDLVLFRDRSDRIGLLHKHCIHRGASLEFGIPMERGLSCCYHGWTFDIDGTILDTPAEPPTSRIRQTRCQGAYPVHVHDGLVFAYFGPPEARPPFPVFDTARGGAEPVPFAIRMPCNWLQVYENTQDPVHVVYLHTRMSGAQFGPASGATQAIEYRQTPLGMINVQTRRWGEHFWTRCTETILPNANQTGAIWEAAEHPKVFQRAAISRWMVPMDDTHTAIIGWRYFSDELDPQGLGDRRKVGRQTIDFIGQTEEERSYAERQRQPGDYEVQVSQRAIAVHALETLASSDQGVAMLRRLVRRGLRAVAAGEAFASYPVGADGLVATFCQDTVMPASARPGTIDDREGLAAIGRLVADAVIDSAGEPAARRRAEIHDRLAREGLQQARK
ncbi:MAG: Rieske 2Fe-2S domain-containing protein [Alphaproteobacteria bacterium]|nr:Rieske 2Fe-2S domain-containing protein [Alphaproteobacteria bacterium]